MVSKELIAWWKDLRKVLLWLPEDYPYLDAIDDLIKHGPEVSREFVTSLAEEWDYLAPKEGDVEFIERKLREAGVRVKEPADE